MRVQSCKLNYELHIKNQIKVKVQMFLQNNSSDQGHKPFTFKHKRHPSVVLTKTEEAL